MTTLVEHRLQQTLRPAPPLATLAGLLLWGWQTDFMLFAITMGLLLELPWLIKWRIDFSDKDINQIVDLSGLVFFLTIIYVFINYGAQGIYKVLELLPFALFLVLMTQRYSASNSIKTSALFMSIRRLGDDADDDILYNVDISMPYVFTCLISASAGHKYSDIFFICCAVIVLWLLWSMRPRHFSIFKWFVPVMLALAIAFVTQTGIRNLHSAAESFMMTLFDHYGWRSRDPTRAMTAIGQLGRLKLSDRIIIRATTNKQLTKPLYLREVTYGNYEYGIWSNKPVEFDVIEKTPGKKEWKLINTMDTTTTMDMGLFMQDQSAIIPAPVGIRSLFGQDIVQVERNPFGAVRIDAREGWINYRLGVSDEPISLTEPIADDLYIFDKYKPLFKQIAEELDLYSKTPTEIIDTVEQYFAENFYYSVTQNQRFVRGGYLEKFLLEHHKGHCEYFATATTLLLREAGIPARYTIGYVMSEYNAWQNSYVARGRDAHSWVQYYLNGRWHKLDTTPSVWAPLESEDRLLLEPLIDFFSWLRYVITSEDIEGDAREGFNFAWLLIPLLLYLGWSFSRKDRVKQNIEKDTTTINIKRYGEDSPFYKVIEKLEKEKDRRKPGETLTRWIKRILPQDGATDYGNLIELHNRYRFNPSGDKKREKQYLVDVTNRSQH